MGKVEIFCDKYYPYAYEVFLDTGFPVSSLLAQSGIETGWGLTVVGNMMFGIKDTDGLNGNEQLLSTTEYHTSKNAKYPVIMSIKAIIVGGKRLYKYSVKDWFRKYETPEESFMDHANFLLENKRYEEALKYRDKPTFFSREIARAGYATGPEYEKLIIACTLQVYNYLESKKLEQ